MNPTGLASALAPAIPDCAIIINERFDDIRNLADSGWVLMNHSEPLGAVDWFQGNDEVFPAFDGDPTAYIAANFNNGGDLATISNWLLTPEISLQGWQHPDVLHAHNSRLCVSGSAAGSDEYQ